MVLKPKPCYGCGTPIPQLILEYGKFNFRCTKCTCETRQQETLEIALSLWNEGKIYPQNEKLFWSLILGGKNEIGRY